MEWGEIAKYFDAGILVIIFALFAKGFIVSRRTLDDVRKGFEKRVDNIVANNKETVERVCKTFEDTTQKLLQSDAKHNATMKEVIGILKENNKKKGN